MSEEPNKVRGQTVNAAGTPELFDYNKNKCNSKNTETPEAATRIPWKFTNSNERLVKEAFLRQQITNQRLGKKMPR